MKSKINVAVYKALNFSHQAVNWLHDLAENPQQRNIILVTSALTSTLLTVSTAHASSGGFAEMLDTAAEQGNSMQKSIARLSAAGGAVAIVAGLVKWYRRGNEGDHSQIKASHIVVPILAGVCLTALYFILDKAGETVGIQSSDRVAIDTL